MTQLTITRTLAAPPSRVWRAVTEPAALAEWFWPARFGTTAEVDLRPGGRYRIASALAGLAVSGRYLEVRAPHRLVFTWQWDGEERETRVTLEISASGPGSELVLVHEGFAGEADRDSHDQGWSDCLDRLPAWLAVGADLPS